jgi:hypothetical protein
MRNTQLQFSKYFSISLYDKENNETMCDYMRCEEILDKISDPSKVSASDPIYLKKASILSCVDSRSDIGRLLLSNQTSTIEICWFFTLTKEKMRFKCVVEILES